MLKRITAVRMISLTTKYYSEQYVTVLVLRNQHQNFDNKTQNFNAGFVKPALYNFSCIFCLMIFNYRYQTKQRKKNLIQKLFEINLVLIKKFRLC